MQQQDANAHFHLVQARHHLYRALQALDIMCHLGFTPINGSLSLSSHCAHGKHNTGVLADRRAAAQAFKSYDEAGAGRRIQCLKYLVLATMLMESAVDPFDAQEAAPYKQDPEVLAMTNLVAAYQENNIKGFERILKTNKCAP